MNHQDDDPDHPIMVISTSFGGGGYSGNCDAVLPAMTRAAANAVSAGITVFASCSNVSDIAAVVPAPVQGMTGRLPQLYTIP